MHLLYLDDSGSAANPGEAYLVLAGLSVFERQVHWLSSETEKLAREICPQDPHAVEFHASEIFSGRKPPWNSMKREARREVLRKVLQVVANSHESTRAFGCAIHKASFPNTNPMELAFEDLCRRFDLLLQRLYHSDKDAQRGLIIIDESSYETSLQRLTKAFRTLGTRWGVLRNLADIPLFADSRASRLLQLADHVAYAIFRRYEASDTSYLDVIMRKFDSEEGRIHGLVHKQTRDPECACPACLSRRLTSAGSCDRNPMSLP
jgi:hypothetical protein